MARSLKVDKSACISCLLCVDVLPTVFKADASGLAEVQNSSGASEEEIRKIIDACPASCIFWEES